jgi:hypothetical protein
MKYALNIFLLLRKLNLSPDLKRRRLPIGARRKATQSRGEANRRETAFFAKRTRHGLRPNKEARPI